MSRQDLAKALARAFVTADNSVDEVFRSASALLGHPWPWLRGVVRRYQENFAHGTRPRTSQVASFLLADRGFRRALQDFGSRIQIEHWLTQPPEMQPASRASTWDIPAISSIGELADWLWLEPGDLEWFANLHSYPASTEPLRHYRYSLSRKRSGHFRLIEAPKRRLKKTQREILRGILDRVRPHLAAHGFVPGRSIHSFVEAHVGQHLLLRMDIRDFFPSIRRPRVQAVFRTLGFPENVADLLGALCTNAVSAATVSATNVRLTPETMVLLLETYSQPHLPQGAPTSPSLANVCFFRADARLSGLAKSAGAVYTRYADDLAFSGGQAFARVAERFSASVAAVLLDEGFTVNYRKTRFMRRGAKQHLAGLVVNEKANLDRAEFDRLKAILTNCIRSGAESQNRTSHAAFQAHLLGKVTFAESVNHAKARRLRSLYNQIVW